MMNNKNRLQWTPLLLASCLFVMDTVVDASWVTRRRRRKELAQKQEQAQKKQNLVPKKKSKITDLKQMIDVTDAQTLSAAQDAPGSQNNQSIFDEDKYALPMELRQEAPKPPMLVEAKKEEEPLIEFNFEGAGLLNLIQQIEAIFDVTFITDDAIKPLPKTAGGVEVGANKITFKTNEPLTKQQAWDLFLTFLDVSGYALTQQATPNMYRIKPTQNAYTSTLRTFIGTSIDELPESDEIIRFMYFIENSEVDTLRDIVNSLKSPGALALGLNESKAILITDKSYNIRSLMKIVKELDKVSMPQAMSILKLRQANAADVQKLYDALTKPDQAQPRMMSARRQPTSLYFPENTKIIAEPRTNSLILLGQRDAIQKIEDFIIKNIDIDLEQPYSPLNIYKLKYADAKTIAKIMNETTALGEKTPGIGTSGGVRGGDKYLKPITFTPEEETNQLIIKGSYEDYMAAVAVIDKLDIAQPQIAIEVLILELQLDDTKSLGAQLRSKNTGCADNLLGKNIKFQTSGLFGQGIVTNPNGLGVTTLLGNLINLVNSAGVGNTVLTLGQDVFGVWGVLALLESITNVQIVSNPFLVTTNKTAASVKVGQTRRVINGVITTGGTTSVDSTSNTPQEANLKVTIKPQINSDGMIILDINVHIERFTVTTQDSTANTSVEDVTTFAIVADKEVLALGGLIQNRLVDNITKVPLLGDIPVIGWLFKNRRKELTKSNLLILISPQIIKPEKAMQTQTFTKERIRDYQEDLAATVNPHDDRDPVYRSFFKSSEESTEELVDKFLFERHKSKRVVVSPVLAPASKQQAEEDDTINKDVPEKDKIIVDDRTAYTQLQKKVRTRSSLRDYMSDAMEAAS